MRKRAQVQNRWLSYRLENVLPNLMRRENIDMWVIIAREYNEDPVIDSMLPATWLSARRRTILIFYDNGQRIERLTVSRYDIGDFYKQAWNKKKQPNQWKRVAELIKQRDPNKIALNYSRTFAQADGITMTQYKAFKAALPPIYQNRIVSGEELSVGWLETRIKPEMMVYHNIVAIAHDIIAKGLSADVIQPGVTTTEDVEWWYRERIRELKLTTWFHPSVSVQRKNVKDKLDFSENENDGKTILPGDLIHVDFGISYLGLKTDTQQLAYVLKPGETEAPKGLKEALDVANRLQDILTNQFETGRTGNEILDAARKKAISEGITPSIYTHPIGFYGHGAGPTIGLWDQQEGVEGKGEYKMHPNTAYSIELNAAVYIPEWDKKIAIMLEEDAFFTGDTVRCIDGRQTKLWLIPRN